MKTSKEMPLLSRASVDKVDVPPPFFACLMEWENESFGEDDSWENESFGEDDSWENLLFGEDDS